MRKLLSKAPVRLQGMLLQLQRYDLNVSYTPGKHMYRDGDNINENPCDERVVYALGATDALSEEKLSQLKRVTAADSVLQAVCKKHVKGWPTKNKSLD